tara:strand:+ start:1626 stop:2018 length:393 start_codon:yes stop_codon:yes gene_type:complete
MNQPFIQVTPLVKEYDKVIAFYTKKLNFTLIENTKLSPSKSWVRVWLRDHSNCSLLFFKTKNEARISDQTDSRVILFLHTDNFDLDYNHFKKRNIDIIKTTKITPNGNISLFTDLYGNLIDVIKPSSKRQ